MAKIEGLGELPQSNMFDELPDFTRVIHNRENNQKSQGILDENRQKFTGQCAIIMSLFNKGVVLSSYSAMVTYGIGHLARRIKDLRDNFGINIDEQFQKTSDNKSTRNLLWFIYDKLSEETKVRYKIEHFSATKSLKTNKKGDNGGK